MGKYNHHFKNNFGSCRLLARTRDEHRDREVTVHLLPGEWEHVGVSDGTDSWIAPVSADPFSVSVKRILADILAGKNPEVHIDKKATPVHQDQPRARRMLKLDDGPPLQVSRERRRLPGISPTGPLIDQPQTLIRRRHVAHS